MTETLSPIQHKVKHEVRHYDASENCGPFVVESISRQHVTVNLFTSPLEHGDVHLHNVVAVQQEEGLFGPNWTFVLGDGQRFSVQVYMQD